jgi:hypothetical protein
MKKLGGPHGRHKIRGPAKDRKKGVTPKSINFNTMTPKVANSADRALGQLRGGR